MASLGVTDPNVSLQDPVFSMNVKWMHDTVECKAAAKRLSHALNWMRDNGLHKMVYKDFIHSNMCMIKKCRPFCNMFRRCRLHIINYSGGHFCALKRIYCLLREMHAKNCPGNCGLTYCMQRRERRQRAALLRRNLLRKREWSRQG